MANILILLIVIFLKLMHSQPSTRWLVEVKSHEANCLDDWYLKMGFDEKKYFKKKLPVENWFVLEVPNSFTDVLKSLPCIQSISLDLLLDMYDNIPNDPYFIDQSNMSLIGMTTAWDISTGGLTEQGDTIVVAIIDDGFEINHEDLKNNIWHNNGEIPNDDIDNDNNGYIDDYFGINITNGGDNHTATHHGTSVCGIIGAIGNNEIGISGINRNIKIMVISYDSHISELIEAYQYVVDMRKKYNDSNGMEGALVVAVNLSAGIDFQFEENYPLWCSMYDKLGTEGVLGVCSVANRNQSVDEDGGLPALCSSSFTIIVTNVTPEDKLQENAAYGRISVDLGAPGELSLTTDTSNSYSYFSGTSAATPHVAGTIALLYSISCNYLIDNIYTNPSEIAHWIKNIILSSGTPNNSLTGLTLSGKRLQVDSAVKMLHNTCEKDIYSNINIRFISPNPSGLNGAKVYFEYLGVISDINIELYTLNGTKILSKPITIEDAERGWIYINTTLLPAGLYLVGFNPSKYFKVEKLIVK